MLQQSVSAIKLKTKSLTSIQRLLGVYQISKILKILKLKYKEKQKPNMIEKQQINFQLIVQKALSDLSYFKKFVLRQRQKRREILNKLIDEEEDKYQNENGYQNYFQAIQQTLLLEEQVLISQIQYYCQNNNFHFDNQFIEQNFNRILLQAKSFGKKSFLNQEDIVQNFIKMTIIIRQNIYIIENIMSKIINYSEYHILKIINLVVLDICAIKKQFAIYEEEEYIIQLIKNPQYYVQYQNEIKNLIF